MEGKKTYQTWHYIISVDVVSFRYLLKERERLQMARDRIREQRRALLSPAGKGENKNELDVISFLKGMGLYRRYESPLLTPLPWERPRYKNGKRVRYVACPLFKNWQQVYEIHFVLGANLSVSCCMLSAVLSIRVGLSKY